MKPEKEVEVWRNCDECGRQVRASDEDQCPSCGGWVQYPEDTERREDGLVDLEREALS